MSTSGSNSQNKKILVAMSGGVDSSMAAKLLTEAGYDCIGCMMKLWENDGAAASGKTCCSLDDAEDARSVARSLGISFYVFNFTEEFKNIVIGDFVENYENGRTPNPCILCNRCMKFGKLYQRARELGCEYIATGHYARIEDRGGRFMLKKALDETKDQSYVLYNLTQEQLSHTFFPLGELRKEDVRSIASAAGFVNSEKPDSQDICFVPDGDYASVVERYSDKAPVPGNFVDMEGNVLGRHKGIVHYTLGQRRGLGISAESRLYVIRIDVEKNEVVLGRDEDLFSREVFVTATNWIDGERPREPFRAAAKIRYRHREQPALITPLSENRLRITFDEPQRAATPGQSAVIYSGDTVLGGGIISVNPF
ncbi:MAG: tRNA 2-thiouridine(34) synthase MnmA [Lachnospiraceae bacterium]|nr:tRNA 2-thiouridine(34) synthase MnmA [Lachnospiraceae bacterium]